MRRSPGKSSRIAARKKAYEVGVLFPAEPGDTGSEKTIMGGRICRASPVGQADAEAGLQPVSFLLTKCNGRRCCPFTRGKTSCSDGHRCVDRLTCFSSSPRSR